LALGRGDLKATKYGTRTPIDVEAGLAWLASMPQACITTGQHYSLAEGSAVARRVWTIAMAGG
jgi:hypothetical protein